MDILVEILLDIYMECMFLIVPEDKRSKKHYLWAKILAVVCTLGVLALALWGGVTVFEDKKLWGWIPLGIAILFSALQITVGIVLFIKRNKKE